MPKVYFVRDETGFDGPYYPTLKEAQTDFQRGCDMWAMNPREFIPSTTPQRVAVSPLC